MKVPQGSPIHSELAPHVILIYKENRTVKSGWLVFISFNSCLLSLHLKMTANKCEEIGKI